MKMQNNVGIALLAFVFLFGLTLLFGFFGQANDIRSATLFTIGCFALTLFVLGTIYVMKRELFQRTAEHALVIALIVLLSAGIAAGANSVKGRVGAGNEGMSTAQTTQDLLALQEQNDQFLIAEMELINQFVTIRQGNLAMRERLLAAKAGQSEAQLTANQKQLQAQLEAEQAQLEAQAAALQNVADQLAQERAALEEERAALEAQAYAQSQTTTYREDEEDDDD